MISRVWTVSCLRLMSVAALVVALQAVLSTDAAASCGDWLAGHPPHGSAADHSADGASTAETRGEPDMASNSPDAPLDPPRPCSGLGCRRAPEAPPPTAPQRTLTDNQDRWLTLAGRPPVVPACVWRLVLEETLDLSAGLRPRVERPPRV
ncbi:MAG TPA: hypothetical protein VML55_04040 [Planctomycetaceae bacterium]|nr:hypothetical protein [Planctomycetaceae bacterium]